MTPERTRSPWIQPVLVALAASAVVTLVVLAFTWPTKTATPQNIPVSVVGPQRAVDAFEQKVEERSPDTFDFVAADSRADAVAQIKHRETYGAVLLSGDKTPPIVFTAPAAGAAPAQILNGLAAQLQTQITQQAQAAQQKAMAKAAGNPQAASAVMARMSKAEPPKVRTAEVVSLSDQDPNGSGLATLAFPLALGGVIGGAMLSALVRNPLIRLLFTMVYAAVASLLLVLITHTWFEFIPGEFWLLVLGVGATLLATALFIVGCATLLGSPGIAVGAITTVLVANPMAGATAPWQFLPEPWGAIGQHMVPGAGNSLVRGLAYFPEADHSGQWWVLITWMLVGAALTALGVLLRRNTSGRDNSGSDTSEQGGEPRRREGATAATTHA